MSLVKTLNRQNGVSLLEVLIALLVLAIGILGFAGLQMSSLNQSTDANHRVTAVLIAQDAVERMELNPAQRDAYLDANWSAGTLGGSPSATCINATCSSNEMATWDIAQLSWQAANQLPGGRITASDCPFNNLTCIVVSWDTQDPATCISAVGINVTSGSKCFVLEAAR